MTFFAARRISPGVRAGVCAAERGASCVLLSSFAAADLTEVLPRRIARSLRFIALHMICVSSRPDAPTIPPMATSIVSPTAMPAMPPATPLREFSKEIVIGISAPPTRMANATPKNSASTAAAIGCLTSTAAVIASTVTTMIAVCPFQTTGFCGRSLCSLPAAIRLPENVRKPITSATSDVYRENMSPACRTERIATSALASPPRPFSSATACGIWIILIFAAAIRLMTAPIAMLIQMTGEGRI